MKNFRVHFTYHGRASAIVVQAKDRSHAYSVAAEKLEQAGIDEAVIGDIEELG